MKRFVIGFALLGLLGFGTWYAYNYMGFYVDLSPGAPVTAWSMARGNDIYVRGAGGEWEPFTVRGVVLGSTLPGYPPVAYQPDESTYLRWMGHIGELGANTIRVYTVMDDEFYNALYEYNTTHEKPLWLLQSVRIPDRLNDSAGDAYDMGFEQSLAGDAVDAVDVIHGRRIIPARSTGASGSYTRDVSPWVLGFIIGHEWSPATIAYTDNGSHPTRFEGEYVRTAEGASAFEAMLVRVMDRVVGYESRKYKTQRLISFINDPQHDPFAYDQQFAKRIAKFSRLDIGHAQASEKFEAGLFAAYRVYPFLPDFWSYLSAAQRARLGRIPQEADRSLYYSGYTQLLAEYHEVPVVVVSFGYSSSRGVDNLRYGGPLSERRQGELLAGTYEDIIASGCAGAVISGFTDIWGQRSWNTAYAMEPSRTHFWHDLQTSAQGTGLLAFGPGADAGTVDGDPAEWADAQPLLEQDGIRLFARYDEEGLYLCIAGDVSPAVPLYVPIDTTQKSGGYSYREAKLAFSRGADFLLVLDGTDGGRLLVQARYEALRSTFFFETTRQDAYIDPPAPYSPEFVPILSALSPVGLPPETPEGQEPPPQYGTLETGRLTYGVLDPASPAYNSLADYYFGPGVVEVRLPWALLNFSDPSSGRIHDDYYEHYGVQSIAVGEIHIGLAQPGKSADFGALPLSGWEEPAVHERLKQSYYVVRQAWEGKQ
ncbi:MAG TPA: hypothetical protein VLA21_06140 [Candidatus Limnocylindria bacterium]|nr:hypothetical protein [Candidatus Limnocylindria bacterium]